MKFPSQKVPRNFEISKSHVFEQSALFDPFKPEHEPLRRHRWSAFSSTHSRECTVFVFVFAEEEEEEEEEKKKKKKKKKKNIKTRCGQKNSPPRKTVATTACTNAGICAKLS